MHKGMYLYLLQRLCSGTLWHCRSPAAKIVQLIMTNQGPFLQFGAIIWLKEKPGFGWCVPLNPLLSVLWKAINALNDSSQWFSMIKHGRVGCCSRVVSCLGVQNWLMVGDRNHSITSITVLCSCLAIWRSLPSPYFPLQRTFLILSYYAIEVLYPLPCIYRNGTCLCITVAFLENVVISVEDQVLPLHSYFHVNAFCFL